MKRILVVLCVSCALSAFGQKLTVQKLRSQLSKKHARWQAGVTKTSILSEEEQKRLLGAPRPPEHDYFFVPTPSAKTKGTSSFDWRNAKGINYASPILDQGRCGSCVAFAAIGLLETQMNITRKTSDSPWEFSPQFLFSCGGGSCEQGWTPTAALSFLEKTGVPDEACFPYESGAIGTDLACSKKCSDARSRSEKISNSYLASFFFTSINGLKKAIRKGPVLTTMTVYEDLMFYKKGVYEHASGKALGGHAVVLQGWSDADRAWLVRNSWGPDWGEGGYFRVSWDDESGLGRMAWGIEVPGSQDGMVSLGTLRDYAVFSGKAQPIPLEATFADLQRLRWELTQDQKAVAQGASTGSGTIQWDSSTVADGSYELVAIAERTSGAIERSQPRQVYVLNGSLQGAISLDNAAEGDTLKGEKILHFSLKSAPIPFSYLIFRAKNATTGELVERRTLNVASRINLKFYSPGVANGDWDLWLEGVAGSQSIASTPVRVTVDN